MPDPTPDKLAEAIEWLRRWWYYEQGHADAEVDARLLAVCDAAAREAQCRAALRSAEEECEQLRARCVEAERELVVLALKNANACDRLEAAEERCSQWAEIADAHWAERDEARATLAGIERLLINLYRVERCYARDPAMRGFIIHHPIERKFWNRPTLPAAVAAAIEEIEKETT